MTLIVEDGSLIVDSNTYNDATAIESFLSDRGLLSDNLGTAEQIEAMALRSMDWLNVQDYIGLRVDNNQSLPFPRSGITLRDCVSLSSDTIPQELKDAQCWLIYYIDQGTDPSTSQTQLVKREKVDVLEIEYQDGGSFSGTTISDMPNVANLLKYLTYQNDGLYRA